MGYGFTSRGQKLGSVFSCKCVVCLYIVTCLLLYLHLFLLLPPSHITVPPSSPSNLCSTSISLPHPSLPSFPPSFHLSSSSLPSFFPPFIPSLSLVPPFLLSPLHSISLPHPSLPSFPPSFLLSSLIPSLSFFIPP